jgi:putative iron-regulated protein
MTLDTVAAAVLALASLTAASLPAHAQTAAPAAALAAAVEYQAVAVHYAALVSAGYSDTLAAAQDLQAAIAEFTKAPSADGLNKARKAWLDAREFYGQTEAFRFYGGPIDDAKGPEGQINAWPLDEAYVDYVTGKPKAGLVNNPKIKITKAALIKANERGGEENISAGWHAVEFLLWGQDLSETGPGNRSFEDFVVRKGANAERRAMYLTVATCRPWPRPGHPARKTTAPNSSRVGRSRCARSSLAWARSRAANSRASAWKSPSIRRTRKTNTHASRTTPTATW